MGGLSVLGRAIKAMPNENYIYLGDSLNQPYTNLPRDELVEICIQNCEFLYEKGVKAIVVACNTATMVAIDDLQKCFNIPILGMWPAIKTATETCGSGQIIIMATETTLASKCVKELLEAYGKDKEIYKLACPKVITLVENGITRGKEIEYLLRDYFKKYDMEKPTTIVLGCTHFGYLGSFLMDIFGQGIQIIDGAVDVVKRLYCVLQEHDILCRTKRDSLCYEIYNSMGAKKAEISKKMLLQFLGS
ncbi:MAG TPA: glutamate racemase [Thermoanaerobacterales bacterium]|nr:glutamate racemase [Thermoanaerobacterales bacterium]